MTHDPMCPCTKHPSKCYSTRADGVCFSCKCKEYAKVRADERERLLEDWAAGKLQGYTSNDWRLGAARQKNYEQGQHDMLAKCIHEVRQVEKAWKREPLMRVSAQHILECLRALKEQS
jgi:hypothetical protein